MRHRTEKNNFKKRYLLGGLLCVLFVSACNEAPPKTVDTLQQINRLPFNDKDIDLPLYEANEIDLSLFQGTPNAWGEFLEGVKTELDTTEQVIALTFDACGGPNGNLIDEKLIRFLITNEIPSTLFVNARWITENEEIFLELAPNPLFQIENHGTEHKPLSVNGQSAWGIHGTSSPEEALEEIIINHELIFELTGEQPTMFRPGTAFFDDIAVEMLHHLSIQPVNYSILGDAGATFNADQVKEALLEGASPGAVALLHMNQPNSGTADGVIAAIPILQEAGYSFVQLNDFPLK